MNLPSLSISWVDMLTALVLLVGFTRGRKRGISEELLDTVQWVVILIAGGLLYRHLGNILNQKPILSKLTYYIFSYVIIALLVKLFFTLIKRGMGQKIIEGDVFGKGEYYLGMMAGMARWTCMYLFFLSLLHAPLYTPEERADKAKSDAYNYGDISFPTVMSIQDEVFTKSMTGKYSQRYLALVLMQPESSESKPLRDQDSLANRRQREVDAAFFGR